MNSVAASRTCTGRRSARCIERFWRGSGCDERLRLFRLMRLDRREDLPGKHRAGDPHHRSIRAIQSKPSRHQRCCYRRESSWTVSDTAALVIDRCAFGVSRPSPVASPTQQSDARPPAEPDQHDVAVEACRDLDRHVARCERVRRSQPTCRSHPAVRRVAIRQRHPCVVDRILRRCTLRRRGRTRPRALHHHGQPRRPVSALQHVRP